MAFTNVDHKSAFPTTCLEDVSRIFKEDFRLENIFKTCSRYCYSSETFYRTLKYMYIKKDKFKCV